MTVADNLSYTVTSQSNGSNPYPNPALREVNLQPYIALDPSSVWIRFSWTTNFPNQASDPNVWIAYGWLIDDVSLRGAPANRVTIQQEVIGGYWVDFLNSTGAGNNPSARELSGKWNNTSNQITSIKIKENASGGWASGSVLKVWGAD